MISSYKMPTTVTVPHHDFHNRIIRVTDPGKNNDAINNP